MTVMNYQTKYLKDNMMLQKKNTTCFLHLLVCLFITNLDLPNLTYLKPDFQTSVYDYAKVLSDAEKHN
jgi:uncharacterized protein